MMTEERARMIDPTSVCPDCDQIVDKRVQVNDSGVPFWICPKCGVVHEDRSWYRNVSTDEAGKIIETRRPFGRFVLDTENVIVGIDNSTADVWTEEFVDMAGCLKWLLGEKEVT